MEDLKLGRKYYPPNWNLIKENINSVSEIDKESFGHWLSGFTDGEGCFCIGHRIDDGSWVVTNLFQIGLRFDDVEILEKIKSYLNCGKIRYRKEQKIGNPSCTFSVINTKDLSDKVIPFFSSYKLRAKKSKDFLVWKKAVELIQEVKSRPFSFSLGRIGMLPKWKETERKELEKLASDLRNTREYIPPISTEEGK